jgi:hypothetical protein
MNERHDLDERQLVMNQLPDFIRIDVQVHPAGTRDQGLRDERMRNHPTDGVGKLRFEVLDVCWCLDGALNVTLHERQQVGRDGDVADAGVGLRQADDELAVRAAISMSPTRAVLVDEFPCQPQSFEARR